MKPKIILHLALMILALNTVNAEKYLVLDINYILGSVTFNSINLREIDRTISYNYKSGFLIKTVSFEDSEIQKFYYNLTENKNYIIYVPYNKNAAKILVYNPSNSIVMDIDVSSFADTCGNKICEPYESYESCQADCNSGTKDGFCDGIKDGICDPDCSPKTDTDCAGGETSNESISIPATASKINKQNQNQIPVEEEPKEKPNYLMWGLLFSGVIILALIFLFIKKRRENQIVNSLKEYISENIRRGFTIQQIKDVLFRDGYNQKEIDKAMRYI